MAAPCRGEVWFVDLDPIRGHEQAGRRPGVVISADTFNHGPAGLVVLVPVTRTSRGIPLHVEIDPPEGGLTHKSFAKCEDVRFVSIERLSSRRGVLSACTLAQIEDRLRILLQL